ncbi:MAG: helix-turn-helix domain-containing protein [Pelistega sp.]|nr:helix-turn-helix domain-containing protein [Pelistega sp.]
MSLDTPDLTKASANAPDIETLGGYLAAARLAQQMTVQQVSEATKYHVSQLRAIEEQQWDKLPTGFVLRSIVKKYAAAVGADIEVALDKLAKATGNVIPQPNKNLKSSINHKVNEQLNERIADSSNGTWLWILLIIVVLGIVGYIAFSQGMFSLDDFEFIKKWFGDNV